MVSTGYAAQEALGSVLSNAVRSTLKDLFHVIALCSNILSPQLLAQAGSA